MPVNWQLIVSFGDPFTKIGGKMFQTLLQVATLEVTSHEAAAARQDLLLQLGAAQHDLGEMAEICRSNTSELTRQQTVNEVRP